MSFHYLRLSFIVIHILNAIKKNNSFELNKNVILKTFDSNVPVLFREIYIQFDYKQRETCSEIFFRTVFSENIKTESNSTTHDINSETNSPSPIINVVCKYLRQVLGTSFGVANLPICCNIQ